MSRFNYYGRQLKGSIVFFLTLTIKIIFWFKQRTLQLLVINPYWEWINRISKFSRCIGQDQKFHKIRFAPLKSWQSLVCSFIVRKSTRNCSSFGEWLLISNNPLRPSRCRIVRYRLICHSILGWGGLGLNF